MNNKIILTSLIAATFLTTNSYAEFNLFGSSDSSKKEETSKEQTSKEQTSKEEELLISEEEKFLKRKEEEKKKLLELKQQSLEDYIGKMKKDKREEYLLLMKTISEVKEKRKYNKKVFKTYIDKRTTFITLNIPFQQVANIVFDKEVIKIKTADNKDLKIEIDKETAKSIKIENSDLYLSQNLQITFADGTKKNISLEYGDNYLNRYVEFRLYMGKTKIEILPEFKKKLSIRNIHSYFNHVSTKLILDKILKKESFRVLEENKKIVNKVLFDGEVEVESFYGKGNINYRLTLDTVYETPYIKDVKGSEIKKQRLVLLEISIKNNNFSNLIITPEFIKKRFANYTAMYLGERDKKENEIGPKKEKKFIVVIADEYIDD